MKRIAAGLLMCSALLLAMPAQAGVEAVQSIVIDHFDAPEPSDFELEGGCGGGIWRIEDRTLRFSEGDDLFDPLPEDSPLPEGSTETACGTARLAVPVPAGSDHLHVRFHAERGIERPDDDVPVNALQTVRILHGDGRVMAEVPYMDPTSLSVPMAFYDLDAVPVPFDATQIILEWYVEDRGQANVAGTTPFLTSGVAFNFGLRDVILEYSAAPLDAAVTASQQRQGTLLQEEVRVAMQLNGTDGLVAPRIRVDPGLEFSHVVLPNGTRFGEVATVDQAVLPGFDLDAVQIELHPGFTQVSLPAFFMAEHGDGHYQVVFTSVESVQVVPALVPLIVVLFLVPLPLAAVAFVQARRFEREAFGGYRRTARNLRIAVIALLAYYIAVVSATIASGRLDLTMVWPLPFEGLLVYVQVVLAGIGFTVLWSVAREMAAITKPRD